MSGNSGFGLPQPGCPHLFPGGKMTQNTGVKYRVGVLFVHGIGEQASGDALTPYSEALQNWLKRWIKGASAVHPEEPARILGPLLHDVPAPRNTQMRLEIPGSEGQSNWLLAESHWAPEFRPPKPSDLLYWGLLVVPWALASHFGARLRRTRRSMKVLPNFIYFILAATLLNPLIFLLNLVLLILSIIFIPWEKVRSWIDSIQRWLTATVGDIYVFLTSTERSGRITAQVWRDLHWLAQKCECVAIVAHSQGGAIAHRIVREHELSGDFRLPDEVRLLVTYGSGLSKLSELGSTFSTAEPREKPWDVLSSWKFAPLSALFGIVLMALTVWPVATTIFVSMSFSLLGWWFILTMAVFIALVLSEGSQIQALLTAALSLFFYFPVFYLLFLLPKNGGLCFSLG
jgi:hypothetical protein